MATATLIPTLYTQQQLSEMLQIPERTLEDWRYRNKGPKYIMLGRRVRYTEQAVAEYIESLVS